MRLRRLRRIGWAVWLGVAALVLNAMVPVHLAFDLAEALGAAPSNEADPSWVLFAKLSGHLAPADDDHDGDHHHHPNCPVCSAFGALSGLAPATPPLLLSLPQFPAGTPAILPSEGRPDGGAVVAYRSRAPPTA